MSIEKLSVEKFLQQSKSKVLLDVRSPAEYNHAHIPGAISLPLFTDEERKIVGTAYKQKSREEAIKIGLDFFGPKMRKMVEEVESLVESHQSRVKDDYDSELSTPGSRLVFIYCWRGGMRSAAVAWLLDVYGFKVFTLVGGYKKFRNHVLQTFNKPFSFKILGGFTGSGKTELLQKLKQQGEVVIDLEKIASHKGSAFGAFKMPAQPTQEMFENLLSFELQAVSDKQENSNHSPFTNHHSPIWLEDESQRIGNLNLPSAFWENMRNAPIFFLDIPFEERLNYLLKEYGECSKEKLIEAIQRISKRLGGLDTKNAIAFLEENNYKEAFRILLRYYDKFYLRGLNNRKNLSTLLTKINCETVSAENAKPLTQYQPA